MTVNFDVNHSFAGQHELRLNMQWIAIKALHQRSFRLVDADLDELATAADEDFTVSNFALQLRYKYQISPLSNFFLVYGRGGDRRNDENRDSLAELWTQGRHNHDANQVVAKLRWAI